MVYSTEYFFIQNCLVFIYINIYKFNSSLVPNSILSPEYTPFDLSVPLCMTVLPILCEFQYVTPQKLVWMVSRETELEEDVWGCRVSLFPFCCGLPNQPCVRDVMFFKCSITIKVFLWRHISFLFFLKMYSC